MLDQFLWGRSSCDCDISCFFQGVYQKAQALYYQGDFELALVFYHRGHKLRPELQEFRLGIQKAQEAIDNSVGCKYRAFHPESQFIVIPTGSQLGTRRKSDWSLTKVFSVSPTTSSKFSSQKGHFGAEKKPSSRMRAGAFRTGKQKSLHINFFYIQSCEILGYILVTCTVTPV